jgi:hypothetical protein
MAQAQNTKDVVVRGKYLVDGDGNTHSYCTHIQKNLSLLQLLLLFPFEQKDFDNKNSSHCSK